MNLLAINWTSAFDLVFFGLGMVFIILVVLVGIISLFGMIVAPKVKVSKVSKRKTNETELTDDSDFDEAHLSADYSAAIALALHLYYSDEHDVESQIITIKTVQRRYSPWSSKIYGINNLVK
jgi:Na+-transporting methylmalonyl-CoA/oxaloacetate decarboxylase gamma subunit